MFNQIKDQFDKFSQKKQPKKIAVIGLTPEEITLLTSMLTIIAIRVEQNWQVSPLDEADVFLVNMDCREGINFMQHYSKSVATISYTHSAETNHNQLHKPLRARELLHALKPFDDQVPASVIPQNKKCWPQKKRA